MTEQDDKAREKFGRWYEKNREDFNAKRRQRYAQDSELRKKARENAKRQREAQRERTEIDTTPTVRGGVKTYRPAQVAELIGRSPETLRTWRRNGWLPESDSRHPVYTAKQVKLLKKLSDTIAKYRYAKDYEARVETVVAKLHEAW
jgi:hypothetical protein